MSSPKKAKREEEEQESTHDDRSRASKDEQIDDLAEMKARLENLDLEEKELLRRTERARLQRELEMKEAAVSQLRRDYSRAAPSQDSTTMLSPLDILLSGADPSTSTQTTASHPWMNALGPRLAEPPAPQRRETSEMFLRPAKLTGEIQIHLIPDFVDALIPQMNEETIGSQGSARLTLNYGPKKPKLENLTIQQWVVGNTRIFYTLLEERKLSTMTEIQDYLAYSVKIMELSNRYEWKSVLLYDNEFRRMQAIYNYPWSLDSNHLHTVLLTPLRKANSRTNTYSNSNTDKIICRNYNNPKGCTFKDCKYAHECNRRLPTGKICGQSHPGYSHKQDIPFDQTPGSQA